MLSRQEHELEGRSKTLLTLSPTTDRKNRKLGAININLERLQNAKDIAEKAIKVFITGINFKPFGFVTFFDHNSK